MACLKGSKLSDHCFRLSTMADFDDPLDWAVSIRRISSRAVSSLEIRRAMSSLIFAGLPLVLPSAYKAACTFMYSGETAPTSMLVTGDACSTPAGIPSPETLSSDCENELPG